MIYLQIKMNRSEKFMLYAVKPPSRQVRQVKRTSKKLVFTTEYGIYTVEPKTPEIIHVIIKKPDSCETSHPGIIDTPAFTDWDFSSNRDEMCIKTSSITLYIDKKTAAFRWEKYAGDTVLVEDKNEPQVLERFPKFRMTSAKTERIVTADGEKEIVKEAERVPDGFSYHARLNYNEDDFGDVRYGFGQHEEGFSNLSDKTVYVHQANRKIAIPLMVSSNGWGILFDCYSPMIYTNCESKTSVYCESVQAIDYYFIASDEGMRGVIKGYRYLTGKAALLPKWAYGYIQSQERYETQEEIEKTALQYRTKKIGLDCIVLDWCSWENGKWGQKSFDSSRFPDPAGMVERLHKNHTKFMISVWANSDPGGENHEEFKKAGLFLPGLNVYNALSEEGRKMYWKQLNEGLFKYGVDAWWCDNSEPITPEWNHIERPEPASLYSEYCRSVSNHMPPEFTNSYALYHAQGVYEGQRSVTEEKRVCNLTRSGYTGQQRYGTILWSGDISATWETLSKQVAAGINFSASGMPYWTTDIGAFFVKKGSNWFWRGDYEKTTDDLGYRELFTRWYQWAAYLPVFRGHGTDCRRELWLFRNTRDVKFYDAILRANRTRYSLMPYIYSTAGNCWLNDGSMIEHTAFSWTDVFPISYFNSQYMFGPYLMVCPITEPMYYEKNSEKIQADKDIKIFLPEVEGGWYDFNTGEHCNSDEELLFKDTIQFTYRATIDYIPVFVKAGAIIPMAEPALSTEEQSNKITVRIYPGADGKYDLYEDDGDGYEYEKGEYRITRITYNDRTGEISSEIIHDYESSKPKYDLRYEIQKGVKNEKTGI